MEQTQTMTRKTSRISKLKVGLAAVALGALLVVPSAGAADVLESSDNMTFEVTGGDLTTSLIADGVNGAMTGDTAFTSPSDYASETISGSLVLNVSDDRGSGAGWHVDLTATQFEDPDTEPTTRHTHTIPASAFWVNSAAAPTLAVAGGQDPSGIGSFGAGDNTNDLATTGVTVINAPVDQGMGSYDQAIGVSLDMPSNVYAGAYASTVTATTTSGAGVLGNN